MNKTSFDFAKRIYDLNLGFSSELMAQGAWCGHMNATEYLDHFRTDIIELCEELKKTYSSSWFVCRYADYAELKTDYSKITDEVWKSLKDESHRIIVTDALNEDFIHQLSNSFSSLASIYNHISGRNFDEDMNTQYIWPNSYEDEMER